MIQEDDIRQLYAKRGWSHQEDLHLMPPWAKEMRWNYSLWTPDPNKPIEEVLTSYCQGFLNQEPTKTFLGADGSPYLSKYCIAEPKRGTEGDGSGKIYLHRFHRSDEDHELHNHPWAQSFSLILLNGYEEERRVELVDTRGELAYRIDRFIRKPGDIVEIIGDTFHRIAIPRGEAWTLFFAGAYVQTWHFWDRSTWKYTHWRDFLKAKGQSVD